MKPVLQLALDFITLERALNVAQEATKAGDIWLEAGTPLIKSEGLDAVRELRRRFPQATIVADMKTMDAGRVEVEIAAKAGADIVAVLAAASDSTIAEAVNAAKRYGAQVLADTIEVPNAAERARQVAALGVGYIGVHCPIDVQMRGESPFDRLREVVAAVELPVAVAGGINSETAPEAVAAGASIVVVGGAITKAPDAAEATRTILEAMRTGKAIETDLYKRRSLEQILEPLLKVSTANISDAMHRTGDIPGLQPIVPGAKMAGPAITVRSYPGDWSKPVQAIDEAQSGQVIAIEAAGVGPALWGEEATRSCLQRQVAGVVIDGAIRDVAAIRALRFPAFAKIITPTAGEPKGLGRIGDPIKLSGVSVRPGDWIVGDDDGVVVIPQERVVEVANRALEVVEREEREMAEIERGSTLGKVAELKRWEQK